MVKRKPPNDGHQRKTEAKRADAGLREEAVRNCEVADEPERLPSPPGHCIRSGAQRTMTTTPRKAARRCQEAPRGAEGSGCAGPSGGCGSPRPEQAAPSDRGRRVRTRPGGTCQGRHQPRGGSLDPRHNARADQRPAPAPAPKNNKTTARLTPAPPLCHPDELRTGKARSGAEALPPAPKMASGRASGRK